MTHLWILAFCLCGGLVSPITEDERETPFYDKIMNEGEGAMEEVNREMRSTGNKLVPFWQRVTFVICECSLQQFLPLKMS